MKSIGKFGNIKSFENAMVDLYAETMFSGGDSPIPEEEAIFGKILNPYAENYEINLAIPSVINFLKDEVLRCIRNGKKKDVKHIFDADMVLNVTDNVKKAMRHIGKKQGKSCEMFLRNESKLRSFQYLTLVRVFYDLLGAPLIDRKQILTVTRGHEEKSEFYSTIGEELSEEGLKELQRFLVDGLPGVHRMYLRNLVKFLHSCCDFDGSVIRSQNDRERATLSKVEGNGKIGEEILSDLRLTYPVFMAILENYLKWDDDDDDDDEKQ